MGRCKGTDFGKIKKDKSMLEAGKATKLMGMECMLAIKVITKEISINLWSMGTASKTLPTEIITKACMKTENRMEKDNIDGVQAQFTKEALKME